MINKGIFPRIAKILLIIKAAQLSNNYHQHIIVKDYFILKNEYKLKNKM